MPTWSVFDLGLDLFEVFVKLSESYLPVHQFIGIEVEIGNSWVQGFGALVFLLGWFIDLRLFFLVWLLII